MSNSYIFDINELYQYLKYRKNIEKKFNIFKLKYLLNRDVLIYIKTVKMLIYSSYIFIIGLIIWKIIIQLA